MESESNTAICPTCKGDGRILFMWDRPGGAPGNGWGGCPDCEAGHAYDAAAKAETDAALEKFATNFAPYKELFEAFVQEQSA